MGQTKKNNFLRSENDFYFGREGVLEKSIFRLAPVVALVPLFAG